MHPIDVWPPSTSTRWKCGERRGTVRSESGELPGGAGGTRKRFPA